MITTVTILLLIPLAIERIFSLVFKPFFQFSELGKKIYRKFNRPGKNVLLLQGFALITFFSYLFFKYIIP